MKLKSSTGGETIGDGGESQVFFVGHGLWSVYIAGNTGSGASISLQWCRSATGTFVTYVADNAAGTPTNQTFSATQVAGSTVGYQRCYLGGGMFFKFVDDGAGTGTAWQIDVNGPYVSPAS